SRPPRCAARARSAASAVRRSASSEIDACPYAASCRATAQPDGGWMTRDTYILIADAAHARLFAAHALAEPWRLVRAFVYPRGAPKTADLVTDRPGRVRQSAGERHAALEAHTTPRGVEEVHFVRELAEVLEAARANYRDLVVVAPPHFLGGLRGHLSDAL